MLFRSSMGEMAFMKRTRKEVTSAKCMYKKVKCSHIEVSRRQCKGAVKSRLGWMSGGCTARQSYGSKARNSVWMADHEFWATTSSFLAH
jgi:hypothetical protein